MQDDEFDLDAELDDFFDFVIIDKADLDKEMSATKVVKNQEKAKEKLEREQESMLSTAAELLIVGQGAAEKVVSAAKELVGAEEAKQEVKLEDFKIIKVIDKGSFGKVFHVQN